MHARLLKLILYWSHISLIYRSVGSGQPAWTDPYSVLQQSADGDAQTLTEVDLFISTQRIKVLNADSQVSLLRLAAEGFEPRQRRVWRRCDDNRLLPIIPNDVTSVGLRVRTDSVNLAEHLSLRAAFHVKATRTSNREVGVFPFILPTGTFLFYF